MCGLRLDTKWKYRRNLCESYEIHSSSFFLDHKATGDTKSTQSDVSVEYKTDLKFIRNELQAIKRSLKVIAEKRLT